jgi:hypothetical protein
LLIGPIIVALACGVGELPPPTKDALADARSFPTPADTGRATRPNDACGWIPVADVEAIVGPLVAPPTGDELACRYALPMNAETARRRQTLRDSIRALAGFDSTLIIEPGLDSIAILVSVDVAGHLSIERLGQMAGDMSAPPMVAEVLGTTSLTVDSVKPADRPKAPRGWDVADAASGTADFTGRIGHLKVMVTESATDKVIPSEKKAALAARIRDRTADLPFTYPYAVPDPTQLPPGADPCSLLKPNEAEAVLGKLLVPPYRAWDGGPYASADGSSCAYYTAGHHVLILKPQWTGGKQTVAELRAADDLLYSIARDPDAETADTLDGPWDDVTTSLDGRLGFLMGDRFLHVAYLTSSTNAAGAATLARIALGRLASSSPNR